jgi:hypothetical protein
MPALPHMCPPHLNLVQTLPIAAALAADPCAPADTRSARVIIECSRQGKGWPGGLRRHVACLASHCRSGVRVSSGFGAECGTIACPGTHALIMARAAFELNVVSILQQPARNDSYVAISYRHLLRVVRHISSGRRTRVAGCCLLDSMNRWWRRAVRRSKGNFAFCFGLAPQQPASSKHSLSLQNAFQ